MIYPRMNPKFNKRCGLCEYYPAELDHDVTTFPYREYGQWKAKIFKGTEQVYEDRGYSEMAKTNYLPLTESHMLMIYGERYVAHYQWQSGKWILIKKEGRTYV